jgi:amino acid transporter
MDSPTGRLGTFAGVFTPSVLTILGIILFLRLGYVVGSAGLGRVLIIIALANVISVLTTFSLSAVATNLKVKGGGDYYLISRTLGVEFGGAIGIVLFLAQAVSIAFYCIGFGEALGAILGTSAGHGPQLIALCAVSFLFLLSWIGADLATKFQFVVMALLVAAIGAFFWGALPRFDVGLLAQNWAAPGDTLPFWAIFAIFFPAVTGFTQGVSMSGDLKDPGRSLPRGTFAAVGISIVVYFAATLFLAAALPLATLRTDLSAMKGISRWGILFDAGVIAATLSSAMASFLGAPRILQSLAADRVFPFLNPFAQGHGPGNNPRRGVLLAGAIALITIAMGQLNLVARIVSMFFLVSYGLLNYATYYEASAASPSFRPRFRWYDSRLSLLGFLACLGVMLAIDLKSGAAAVAIIFAVHQYLQRSAGPARWADSQRSHYLQRARRNLLAAADEPRHPRDWRPCTLVLLAEAQPLSPIMDFAGWLEGKSGLTTAVRLIESHGLQARRQTATLEEGLRRDLKSHPTRAFALAVAAPDVPARLVTLVQSAGIGPLRTNTVLLQGASPGQRPDPMAQALARSGNMRRVQRLGCNLILLCDPHGKFPNISQAGPATQDRADSGTIDVWWWGDKTSRLMLMLAYLMTRNPAWENAAIRLLAANYEADTPAHQESLAQILDEARISAQTVILPHADSQRLAAESDQAALVFIPLRLDEGQVLDYQGNPLMDVARGFRGSVWVLAAEDLDWDAAPEEGSAGELAQALDLLEEAQKQADNAAQEAEKAAQKAQDMLAAISWEDLDAADQARIAKVKAARKAHQTAEKAARRAAKAEAKADLAAREAEAKGAELQRESDPDDR